MIKVAMAAALFACIAAQHAGQKASSLEVKLSLGEAIQIGSLAIVPIESTLPLARDEYLTLAEATKLHVIEIVEIPGQQQVNSLEVRNKSKLPILLFAGELLLGGKQDRIVGKDSIIPAGGRRDVPVFCVEHGRWNGDPRFQSGNTFVPDVVRQEAIAGNQGRVWDRVQHVNDVAGAAPSTGTIRGTLDDPKMRSNSDKLMQELDARFKPRANTVGIVSWNDGKIQSADIFANHALFAASVPKLLRSYTMDVQLVVKPRSIPVDLAKCRAFLAEIVSARREASEQTAFGNTFVISSGKIKGYEYGNIRFGGAGGMGGFGGGGFGHGSYKPGGG